jgi:hypothetical protein
MRGEGTPASIGNGNAETEAGQRLALLGRSYRGLVALAGEFVGGVGRWRSAGGFGDGGGSEEGVGLAGAGGGLRRNVGGWGRGGVDGVEGAADEIGRLFHGGGWCGER